MPLAAGQRLGPYEIGARLGAGGMGEVYRARDTRLDRVVALKVVHSSVAASQEMRERFEREARAISALDHPHICALYDVVRETVDGDAVSVLVMQYLEGGTLAEAISRGPIPFETAVTWAAEIGQALDAAHRRGIVHRDLKPGNVMITKAGTKLLDFGLAKLVTGEAGVASVAETRTSPIGVGHGGPLTSPGLILGTLHYMSPEQLEGRDVDTRSDIFSFGAVLFEMLTGRRPFEAQSSAGVIAAILGSAPSLGTLADTKVTLPAGARRALDRVIAKCLARNPDNRWQSAADLAAELQWINEEREGDVSESSARIPTQARSSRTRERVAYVLAVAAFVGFGVVSYRWYPATAALPEPVMFTIEPPEKFTGGPVSIGLSPNGRQVMLMSGPSGSRRLWVRDLDSRELKPIDKADDVWNPVMSADSKSIVYTHPQTHELSKLDLTGGAPRTLANNADYDRPAWNQAGDILYSGDRKLYWIPEDKGQPVTVQEGSRPEREVLRFPMFLPGGRRYIFAAQSAKPEKSALVLANLDAAGRTVLVPDVFSNVDYAYGHLFYQRDGTLMAHPFDEATGRLTGDAFPLKDIVNGGSNGRGAFAVSETGTLVYLSQVSKSNTLALFDRHGKHLRQLGDPGPYHAAALSPDGRQAVITHRDDSRQTLWLMDVERGFETPFTVGDASEHHPVWRGNASIAFQRRESIRGEAGIYLRSARGGAITEELLVKGGGVPTGFSNDGTLLLMERQAKIWVLPMSGRTPTLAFPGGTEAENAARFSPNGKLIAYEGGGPANPVVYVRPYPVDDQKIRISAADGRVPLWTDDRHIVYRASDGTLISVELTEERGTFRASAPKQLFPQPPQDVNAFSYSMDPRTEQFLLVVPPEKTTPTIAVIVNFAQSLGKK